MSETSPQIPPASNLPHSIEAERAVLGALLHGDNVALDIAFDRLEGKHFYRPDHQILFEVMMSLRERNEPIDGLIVTEELKQKGWLESKIGAWYILDLTENVAELSNIDSYVNIVLERATFRLLIEAAQNIAASAFNAQGRDSQKLLDEAEALIFSIAKGHDQSSMPEQIGNVLAIAVRHIEELYTNKKATTGLATPFPALDRLTGGLQPADLIVIAGRPSMGKTSFALNIVEHALNQPDEDLKPVLFFSLEMPAESLATRMLSSLSRVNFKNLREGTLQDDDWAKLNGVLADLSEKPFFIDDSSTLTALQMRSKARRIASKYGNLGLIVVDYLQLMHTHAGFVQTNRESRVQEISEISRQLKALAKEMRCPVIALSQLNRSLERREDKEPVMSDLRDSGAIEQDADVILFIYRDEVYNKEAEKGKAKILLRKQRNGPIGDFELEFKGNLTRFEASQEYEDSDYY